MRFEMIKIPARARELFLFVGWTGLNFFNCSEARAAPTAKQLADSLQSETTVNRAVLTVGREVFSAIDAVAMTMVWNMTSDKNEKKIAAETDWLNPESVAAAAAGDPVSTMPSWPEDLRQFFQMALIWTDIQKLNLFVIRPQDISPYLARFSVLRNKLSAGYSDTVVREVYSASDEVKMRRIESVLRVRAFIRARGNLDRNKNLYSAGWYWHHAPAGLRKTK